MFVIKMLIRLISIDVSYSLKNFLEIVLLEDKVGIAIAEKLYIIDEIINEHELEKKSLPS